MKMEKKIHVINTKVDIKLLEKVNAEIQKLGFKSQSEFMRFSINNTLENINNHNEIVELIKKNNQEYKQNLVSITKVIQSIQAKYIETNNSIIDAKNSIAEIANVLVQLSNSSEQSGDIRQEVVTDSVDYNTPSDGKTDLKKLIHADKNLTPVRKT